MEVGRGEQRRRKTLAVADVEAEPGLLRRGGQTSHSGGTRDRASLQGSQRDRMLKHYISDSRISERSFKMRAPFRCQGQLPSSSYEFRENENTIYP